jgi:hypothetical protein
MTARDLRSFAGFTAYVAFFAWLDWITHRSVAFVVVIGGALVVAALLRAKIGALIQKISLRDTSGWTSRVLNTWARLPWQVRRLIVAVTPLLYFLVRGQGTSGAGGAVLLAGVLVALPIIVLGDQIDRLLHVYYERRDRILPRWLRLVLAPALAVVIAFAVVHGSLLDLPALFGGTTAAPQSPVGLANRFFLATLIAGICTVLLVRERGEA